MAEPQERTINHNLAVIDVNGSNRTAHIGEAFKFPEASSLTLTDLLEAPSVPSLTNARVTAVAAKTPVSASDEERMYSQVTGTYTTSALNPTPTPIVNSGAADTHPLFVSNVAPSQGAPGKLTLFHPGTKQVQEIGYHTLNLTFSGLHKPGHSQSHKATLAADAGTDVAYLERTGNLSLASPFSSGLDLRSLAKSAEANNLVYYTFNTNGENLTLTPHVIINNNTGNPLSDIATRISVEGTTAYGSGFSPSITPHQEAAHAQPITLLPVEQAQADSAKGALETTTENAPEPQSLLRSLSLHVAPATRGVQSFGGHLLASESVDTLASAAMSQEDSKSETAFSNRGLSYAGRHDLSPGYNPVNLQEISLSGRRVSYVSFDLSEMKEVKLATGDFGNEDARVLAGGSIASTGTTYRAQVTDALMIKNEKSWIPAGALYHLQDGHNQTYIPFEASKPGDDESMIALQENREVDCFVTANQRSDTNAHTVDYQVAFVNNSEGEQTVHFRPNKANHYQLTEPAIVGGDKLKREKLLSSGTLDAFVVNLKAGESLQVDFQTFYQKPSAS